MQYSVSLVILTTILAGILLFALRWLIVRADSNNNILYTRKSCLLSTAEQAFYAVLQQVVGHNGQIFVKVRLVDLVDISGQSSNEKAGQLRRLGRRYVDFVLCSPSGLAPILAIKLEKGQDHKKRPEDELTEDSLAIAGLPLLRLKAKKSYDVAKLSRRIRMSINTSAHDFGSQTMYDEDTSPVQQVPTSLGGRILHFLKRWIPDLSLISELIRTPISDLIRRPSN